MAKRPMGDVQIDEEISHVFPRRIFIEKEIKNDEETQTTKIYRCNSANQSECKDQPKWSFALRLIFPEKYFSKLFFRRKCFIEVKLFPTNASASKISQRHCSIGCSNRIDVWRTLALDIRVIEMSRLFAQIRKNEIQELGRYR